MPRFVTGHFLNPALGTLALRICPVDSPTQIGSLGTSPTGPDKDGYEWELQGTLEDLPQGVYDYKVETVDGTKVAGGQVWLLNGDGHYPLDSEAVYLAAVLGGGSGEAMVTITVTDDADPAAPVVGAQVSMSMGAQLYVRTTNANGQCQFQLDLGTWTVAITKDGFDFTPTTLEVIGLTSRTYVLSAAAPSPGSVDGTFTVYDETGTPEPEAQVYVMMVQAPDQTGVYDGDKAVYTADGLGVVTVPNMFVGAAYVYWKVEHGDVPPPGIDYVTIPGDAGSPVELPGVLSFSTVEDSLCET